MPDGNDLIQSATQASLQTPQPAAPQPQVAQPAQAGGVAPEDIDAYGKYLIAQGQKPEDVAAYTQYLAQQHGHDEAPLLDPKEHGILKGITDVLPTVGSIAGGLTGALGGSVVPGAGTVAGEVGGAAAGGVVGSAAKDAINNWIFGEKKSLGDSVVDAAKEGAIGGLSQGAGVALGLGGKALAATRAGSAVLDAAGSAAAKAGEVVFRVPAKVISRYATAAGEIAKMSADADGNIAAASDTVKEGFVKSITEFQKSANEQLGAALKDNPATIDSKPIIDALESVKARLNPKLSTSQSQISQIDTMIADAKAVANSEGQIPVASAHDLKASYQGLTSYGQNAVGDQAAAAAKQAARQTRLLVNEVVPEVAVANNQLAALHSIQNNMVKSLTKPGAAESGLVAAGKGANERNLNVLQKLSKLTGQDFVGGAENLAAMKEFGNASLKKTGALSAIGAGVGYQADGQHGAITGALLGGAVSSPIVLKKAIDLARGSAALIPTAMANQALGQSVMRGSGAVNAIRNAK